MYMFGSGSVPESSSKLAAKLLSCVPLPDRVSVAIFELSKIFPKNSYPGFSVSKRDDVVKLYLLWSSIISSSTRRHLSLMLYGSLNISFWILSGWSNLDEYWLPSIVFLPLTKKMAAPSSTLLLLYGRPIQGFRLVRGRELILISELLFQQPTSLQVP